MFRWASCGMVRANGSRGRPQANFHNFLADHAIPVQGSSLQSVRAPASEMIDEPRVHLREAVRCALANRGEGIARVEIQVEPTCELTWLYAQPWPDRVFWSGRDDGWTMAGAGMSDCIEAASIQELEAKLQPRLASADEAVRYLGTARFRSVDIAAPEWQPFGQIRFVLPRVELRVYDGETTLAINAMPGDSEDEIAFEIDRIAWEPETFPDRLPEVVKRVDAPDESTWCASVDSVLAEMRTTDLEKVVLARRASFEFDGLLDPFVLLSRMRASTQNCFHALIGLEQGASARIAFLSATPERLFRMNGREVLSEAIAGTRLRSSDEERDRLLRDELLHSEKDLREHTYVLEAIRRALDPLTERLTSDQHPSSFNLTSGRHLRSIVKGSLDVSVTPFDLLRSLHPTPAVCGTPSSRAQAAISQHETFDRGLYAGPIGWIGRDSAEFAVGIRSGLVEGNHVHLFSGAGVVERSDPQVEWDEIEHKLDDFNVAMGLVG